MNTSLPPLLLIGAGRMGSALLSGWRARGLSELIIVDPAPAAQALAGGDVRVVSDLTALPTTFTPTAVILAVKPQMAATCLPACARFAHTALFVSIMAGKTTQGLSALLGHAEAIVRAMPNTPAAIRQGMSVAYATPGLSAAHKQLATMLLEAAGQVAWVEDESLLDPVTAISGGGPAYVFLLTELLEQAGLDQGLPAALARTLARQTVIGAAALMAASSETPETLRMAVTSPGGTTAEALKLLRADDALPKIFKLAIEAATQRSRALST